MSPSTESTPLGSVWDGSGVTFALFSEHADAVDLCLFDGDAAAESRRLPLTRGADDVWRARVPRLAPGARYGYRVHGPYAPRDGHRFNAAKLLVDPYARALTPFRGWSDRLLGFVPGRPEEDLARDERDDAAVAPRSIVVDPSFDWGDDRPPRIPWERTLLYEAHVKGLTMRHPAVPAELRGTYLGLATPAVLEHLVALGVTAIELLPVHHAFPERHLAQRGLPNYWGYNTLGFFAPDARFVTRAGAGDPVREFQTMVRALHRAGIEVILDVVYNHTAEGDRLGPTLAFRGIDNRAYYRLAADDLRTYVNWTGCGNTLDAGSPRVLALIVDSLRYWVETMHVDGFRFDLASTLARRPQAFDPAAPFLAALRDEPALAGVKLIAEPWDATPEGYRVGGFPAPWREWNDRYRDTVRRWWRGDVGQVGTLATRLTGSLDLFGAPRRGPTASVDFVTAHDGFSLRDLVSYDHKHNEHNGEDNRDGADDNASANYGAEGPTGDAEIEAVRARQQRNLLATLLLSRGVPMLRAGDEIGQTQLGNNNAYCQDNERTWLEWDLDAPRTALLAFTRRLAGIIRRHPAFRRSGHVADDLVWYAPSGAPMRDADWHDAERRTLGLRVDLGAGGPVLLLLNAASAAVTFTLPRTADPWAPLVDTARLEAGAAPAADAVYELRGRSLAVLATRVSMPR